MLKKNIITMINYPISGSKTIKNYDATLLVPVSKLNTSITLASIDKLEKLLKKLLIRPKIILKDKELEFIQYVNTLINECFIQRSFSILTSKGIIINITPYHNCFIDNLTDKLELNNVNTYIKDFTRVVSESNKYITYNYLIFNYKISDGHSLSSK